MSVWVPLKTNGERTYTLCLITQEIRAVVLQSSEAELVAYGESQGLSSARSPTTPHNPSLAVRASSGRRRNVERTTLCSSYHRNWLQQPGRGAGLGFGYKAEP